MGIIFKCDKCDGVINDDKDCVRIEYAFKSRYLHKDCFNIHFSTDVNKIKELKK